MKINCLLVDDDEQWRSVLTKLVQMNPVLALVATCASAMEAYAQLADKEIDLLICDIEMPEMSGLAFIKSLRQPPLVIFVTSFRDHALACYEVSPVDFLLKPIEPARFLQSIENVRQRLLHLPDQSPAAPYFFVRDNQQYVQIAYQDVLYFQAQENFVQIVTPTETLMPIVPITKLEEQLRSDQFVRVHRSFIVNRLAIRRIGRNELVLTSGQVIPIGDQYRAQLTRKHIEGNLISRSRPD